MPEQKKTKITVSFVLAVAMIVGFAFAPTVVAADDDTLADDDAGGDVVDVDTGGLDTDTSDSSDSTGGVSVNIVDTNSPVQTGETLVVTVDARTDEGGIAELLIDGEPVDSQGFAPGQEGRVNFTWETSYPDAGEHNATVRSDSDSDSRTVEVEPGADAPDGVCRNVPKEANGEVPYGDLPSRDDLPEEAPDPIPPFVTPEAIAGIVVGAAPNQCDIQDPNDPSVDPNDPPAEPSASVIVYRSGQYKDGAVLLVYYEATLNRSGDGPGVSGFAGGIAHSDDAGTNPSVNVNDGEKSYAVDPRFRTDDSTADGSAEVSTPFGAITANLDCSGGECKVTPEGVIEPPENPAIPAPIWDGED